MNKAYRYRLYPTIEQKIMFAKTFGCARFIYNKMLGDRLDYQSWRKALAFRHGDISHTLTKVYACGESVSRHNSSELVVLFSLKQEASASIGGGTFTGVIK